MIIGSNVSKIFYGAFKNCPINNFYSYTQTPPEIDFQLPSNSSNYSFYGIDKNNATLYVPAGCKSAYEASKWATYFGAIVEMSN